MRYLFAALTFGLVLSLAPAAFALDAEVESETTFVAYDVRTPSGRAFMARRRLVSNLRVRGVHVLDAERTDSIRIVVDARLRLDQEFGQTCLVERDLCIDARNPEDLSAYQPLATDTRLDMPTLWVEASGLPLRTRARLGRQMHLDAIGFLRFDGLKVSAQPASFVELSAYAGGLVRGTTLGGSSRFEPQGALRLDDEAPWSAAPSPFTYLVGANVAGGSRRYLWANLALRHAFEDEGPLISRVGLSLRSQPWPALTLRAAGVWDFLTSRVIDARARAELRVDDVRVEAGAMHHVPRFDPSTIWAYFDVAPMTQLHVGLRVPRIGDASVGGNVRLRHAELPERQDDWDMGGDAWVQFRLAGARISASAFGWTGALGPLAGGSLDISRPVLEWLVVAARVTFLHFEGLSPSASSGPLLSEAIEGRARITDDVVLLSQFTHAMSDSVGHRFRLLLALRLEIWR